MYLFPIHQHQFANINRAVLSISTLHERMPLSDEIASFKLLQSKPQQWQTVLEYGADVAIHQIGLYVDNLLVAIVGQKIDFHHTEPLLRMKSDCSYVMTLQLSPKLSIDFVEADYMTYAMLENGLVSSTVSSTTSSASSPKLLANYLLSRGNL